MPPVNGAAINKGRFEIGESIRITGDGCYEPAALIVLAKWDPGVPQGLHQATA
ncbi:MAG TPA: hypothetical protein VE439_10195 [Anaerolineae bacterium]|nr:hypothetical protein [Anaerolineae bacterium]